MYPFATQDGEPRVVLPRMKATVMASYVVFLAMVWSSTMRSGS